MQQKRLLFVSTRRFWPPSSGKEVTLFHNCKGLHERCGYDIYLFCFSDKRAEEPPDFIREVVYADVPRIVKSAPRILLRSLVTGSLPIQNALFYDRAVGRKLRAYFDEVRPDALIIDMVRLVPYIDCLPELGIPHILIEDDLLAKRYRRQLASGGEASISGYMSDSIPGGLNRIINLKPVRRFILKGEIKRLERYESALPDKFDHITFISSVETEEFNEKYHTDKAVTLTLGADIEYCAAGRADKHIPCSMSVVGNFSYGPNAASIEWINSCVMPLLPENVTYYAVGKFPDELKAKLDNESIISLGYVDDIRSAVKATEIYFSPVLFGTGIKTKVVEAMAMGMAVVTNSVGAEGLGVRSGEQLFIADEPEEMARVIKMLLSEPELRDRVGKCGQEYVREYHDWNKIYDTFGAMGL